MQEAELTREVEAARQALRDTQQGSRSSTTQAHLDAAQAELSVALQRAEAAKESHAKVCTAMCMSNAMFILNAWYLCRSWMKRPAL
eukprot:1147670-Pelagomonas_calceolata.AAC.9